ncbi:hypothetical protein FRB99_005882 [Tulasnella sp. 403]|nr:hypothetical protein FRB99_005882 [Tulasnella sp. 403]
MLSAVADFTIRKDPIPFTQNDDIVFNEEDWSYAGSQFEPDEDNTEEQSGSETNIARESMYVRLFNTMLDTVLDGERFLFSDDELRLFDQFRTLPYPTRYLLIRLVLRKPGKWHRSDKLKKTYQADVPQIAGAITQLCQAVEAIPLQPSTICTQGGTEYITIYDSDDEEPPPQPPQVSIAPTFFAQDDKHASVEDLLGCLQLPELKDLAKDMKVPTKDPKRAAMIQALITHAQSQKVFNIFGRGSKPTQNQLSRLRTLVKKITGTPSHRFYAEVLMKLFVCSTEMTAPLLPLILTNTRASNPSHRNYPSYTHTRTTAIFPSREAFLGYEQALEIERQMDDALTSPSRVDGAMKAVQLHKPAFHRWSYLIKELIEGRLPPQNTVGALERFHEGHVLTRIVYKGAYALGVLKRYDEELELLMTLLGQKRWRKGRRGAWYDRAALICTNYKDKSTENFEEAYDLLKMGLEDACTHLIYRPALEKRLARVEKKLNISDEQRYRSDIILRRAKHVLITGNRIIPLGESHGGSTSNARNASEPYHKSANEGTESRAQSASFFDKRPRVLPEAAKGKENANANLKRTGKSTWKGRNGEVSVEEYALEHYEGLGYKGFHSESRIVLHLFTLLFWPILFDSTIPGAFETPFQSSPLDLAHDTFFQSRKDAILERLQDIEDGKHLEFIREADERERERKTWAIGVRWDDYPLEDTLEVAEGIGGHGLATICRLLAEEYSNRGSGVPDLIIWNASEKRSMFVEVKGPGDQLRENQRVWIDVMLRHGIAVEVLRVENWDYKTKSGKGKGKRGGSKAQGQEIESEDEAELDYDVLDPQGDIDVEDDPEIIEMPPPSTRQTRKRSHAEMVV